MSGPPVTGSTVVASQLITLASGQVSAIVNGTTTRGTVIGLDPYVDIDLLINITNGGAATGTLQLYVQDSADGGTTWDDLISSLTFTFGAALTTQRFMVGGRVVPSTITTAASSNITQGSATGTEALAAGSARQGPWGNRLRLREKVSGIAGSPTGVTYSVTAIVKR